MFDRKVFRNFLGLGGSELGELGIAIEIYSQHDDDDDGDGRDDDGS